MSKQNNKSKTPTGLVVLLVVLVLILLASIAAMLILVNSNGSFQLPVWQAAAPTEPAVGTQAEETEIAAEVSTEAATEASSEAAAQAATTVVTADGSKASIRFAASYTGGSAADGSKTVATMGSSKLTNAQLQVLYLSQVAAWQSGSHGENPDFTQPLDTQRCPLGDGDLSWQHYFLQQAVNSWRIQQALMAGAKEPIPAEDPDYKPNETMDLHGTYLYPDLPVHNFLYQDLPCYTPNKMHQAYLDGMEAQLEALAKARGYGSLADYTAQVFGGQVSAADFVKMAQDNNFAYMFFTEATYHNEIPQEEIDSYISKHTLELPSGNAVDLRHILLIPEDAKVAADGTVTADDAQWETCRRSAETMLASIQANGRSFAFAKYANENSQDAGSQLNGGLYANITKGQLIQELDDWCFAPGRNVGDTAVLRTKLGYHIVKLCDVHPAGEADAKEALLLKNAQEKWGSSKATVDYSQVSLWAQIPSQIIGLEDVLYPDVAHERFPEAIVYLQQDFMYTPFGGGIVGKNGCGITTFAMLSTYMTDSIQTPAAMAKQFAAYFVGTGTDGMIFLNGVVDMGYFCEKQAFSVDEIIPALKNGQRVISLQLPGHFTSAGHFLLVQAYNEENDTFQVRDSNVYNYGRLQGHKDDYFTRYQLNAACTGYWIMQPKITRIPACWRCGDTFQQTAPQLLFRQDYLCQRCTDALERREAFLALAG